MWGARVSVCAGAAVAAARHARGDLDVDQRTRDSAEFLDGRYRLGVPQGRYFSHEPIYGIGSDYSESEQTVKLARTYAVFRRLSQMRFDSLLDVGGAEGWHASLAARIFGAQVVTSDLSSEASLRARELFGVPAVASDAHWLPFPEDSFDVVLCCEVLEHVADPIAVVCEVARVARRYAVFATEQTAREPREREILLQLADTKSPHGELHWFLPGDFPSVLGSGVTSERELRLTERLAELHAVGLEPPEAEVRAIALDMTGLSDPTGSDNGILVTWAKGDAPPVDTSEPGDEAMLDLIMGHRVSAGQELAARGGNELDPFLAGNLACPVCLDALRQEAGTIICSSCGRSFEVESGVPRFYSSREDAYPARADPSRWPLLTDEGAQLREVFTAPRGPHSRLVYYLLSAELSLLDIGRDRDVPEVDCASCGALCRALEEAATGEQQQLRPRAPMQWCDRLPASRVELEAMRGLGAKLLCLVSALARAEAHAAQPLTARQILRAFFGLPARALRRVRRLSGTAVEAAQTRAGPFPDVPSDFWARQEIEALARAGICSGRLDGFYRPTWRVSRGDMAIYIARAHAGGDAHVPEHTGAPSFPDMPAADPTHRYVEYGVAQGVLSAYPDGLYHSEHWLDRGQVAVFIARALAGGDEHIPEGPEQPTFADVTRHEDDPHSACYRHIEYLASRGAVQPDPDGRYHPEALCTRAELAVFMARAFDLCS